MYYLPFGIAVLSSVLYHTFQKATSSTVNPALGLLVTYVTAILITLLLFIVFPIRGSLADSIRQLNWASFALGLAIVGLEIGFLLAYRAGWSLNNTGVASNVTAALILLPTGILFFKERPSLLNILGVFVCIIGLVMINTRN
jgi:drug/metabolite transporter (DMT)-like permease